MNAAAAFLALGAALALLIESQHKPMNAGLPLVRADYERCVTIRTGPIESGKAKRKFQRRPDRA